jgi:hypothetical protein
MLHKGFHVALQLVDVFVNAAKSDHLGLSDDSQPLLMISFCSKRYLRSLFMAAAYLVSFVVVDHEVTAHSKLVARNHVKRVYETLMARSGEKGDELFRAAMVVELLYQHAEDENSVSCFKEVVADPSPSLYDNGLKVVRKIRGLIRRTGSAAADQSQKWDRSLFLTEPPQHEAGGFSYDIPPDWDTWLPDADDIMSLLGPYSGHFSQQDWA